MKKLLIALCAISLMVFWACHLDPDDSTVTLDVRGDGSWLEFDRLEILVRDTGSTGDTSSERLFNGRLNSLDELRALPAGGYTGGPALFIIRGFRNDSLALEQVRTFNEATGSAVVETTFALDAVLTVFKAAPESLVLYAGGESADLKLTLEPKYARPPVAWSLEGDAVAMNSKTGEYRKTIAPKSAGKAFIRIEPHGAPAMALRIPVRVVEDAPRIEVSPAKAFIAPGGEVEFAVASHQEYGELVRYEWDLDGDGDWDDSLSGPWPGKDVVLPGKSRAYAAAGAYIVRFRIKDGEGNSATAEVPVEVGERRPAVDLKPGDTVISIRDEIRFHARIQEPGGRLEGYDWDWNGDGKADDEATLSDSTATLAVSRTYPEAGEFRVILNARDRDGKTGADTAFVRVVRDVPRVDAGNPITAKTGVPVAFNGSAFDSLGRIVEYKWDFDGDGSYDDSSDAPPSFTHAYDREADYAARFSVRDDDGNVATAVRMVKISDVPFVITAKRADTTISIKDVILMTASIRNEDGKSLSWSWDYDGDGNYEDTASGNQTSISVSRTHAYPSAGRFKAVFRVADAQGKALVDTMTVTVVLDAPQARLGKDDTVLIGGTVAIKLLDTANAFGSIAKRELRINDTAWIRLSNSDTVLTMPMVPGLFRVIGRVTDDDGLTDLDTLDITVKYPAERRLSGIFLSSGALTPAFDADTLEYSAAYAYTVATLSVGAAARDPKSTITVNGTALTGTTTSVPIPLKPGANPVAIVVTAQDTAAKRTYLLTITRALSPVSSLSGLVPALVSAPDTLKPKFAPGILAYTLTAADSVDTVRFTPTATDAQAAVTVNGMAVASGALSQKLPVAVGSQKYDIVVTAATGAKSTYSVTVVRKRWALVGAKAFAATMAGISSFAVDNGLAYVAFNANSGIGRPDVWKWDKTAWTGIMAGTVKDSGSTGPVLDIIGGVPWMASLVYYQSPAYYINIRKYAGGTSWIAAGKPVSGAYSVYEMNLGHDKADKPYFAYRHTYKQNSHHLYKHADTAWTPQPYTEFNDSVYNLRMAINPATGHPTLAYTKSSEPTYKARIIAHNGTTYSVLGANQEWPVDDARVDFAFDSLGAAYYAYIDPATKLAAVRKYASTWASLGPTTGFSEGAASSICVAVAGATPVVAYRDKALATVIVKYWNGSAWMPLGASGFAGGDAGEVRLAVDDTGVWVAFSDAGAAPKVTVMKRPLP